ncbi:Hemerythrin HHE cation binding domain-containing protein [Salegentibacter salinarum]|nr:Hemerythrin HHE cation binding domain-containing protein [Salegentibacter salinarum]
MNETIDTSKLVAGHPVSVYFKEKELIKLLTEELKDTDPSSEYQKFYNIFNQLQSVERRFERKENQLFPFLEKRGWNNPSQGMWSFHDTLREQFRLLRKKIEAREIEEIDQDIQYLISGIFRLLLIEETTLFQTL